ncbi:MAG: ABC transporter permease [Chloroflexota bacterium]|nr:ABC transporter permease [Chloroflexota bacterium]
MTGRNGDTVNRVWHWIAPALLIAAVLAAWETVVRVRRVPSWLLPPPSAVAETLVVERALLFEHGIVTLSEVLLGFSLALIAGVLLAIAIDSSPALDRSLYPLLVASQTVPVPALAPLLLIWFGYGLLPKVLVTALIAFFPIVVNMVEGLRATDPDVIAMLRTFGAGRWTRFRLARLPSALPFLFAGARIAVAVAVIGAVFGELVGARAGLGYLLTRAMAQFQTERVVAAIFLLSLMGVGLFAIVAVSERLLLPWRRAGEPE